MSFPLPSSPHWAPNTLREGMARSSGDSARGEEGGNGGLLRPPGTETKGERSSGTPELDPSGSQLLRGLLALDHLVGGVEIEVRQGLPDAARRPPDLDLADPGRVAEADLLPRGGPAEAADGSDRPVEDPLARRRPHHDLDPRAVREPVAALPDELQRQEVVGVPGILVERVVEGVSLIEAAHLVEDVLVPVVVEVRERDSVPLLQVAEAPGDGDVLEPLAADVVQH